MGYRKSQDDFMSSIINEAKHRKTLTQKQMETVAVIYKRIKKNIADNANNA